MKVHDFCRVVVVHHFDFGIVLIQVDFIMKERVKEIKTLIGTLIGT